MDTFSYFMDEFEPEYNRPHSTLSKVSAIYNLSCLIQRNVRVLTFSYQWWAERLGLNFRLKLNRINVLFHTVEREKKVPGLYKATGLVLGIRVSCPKFNPQLAVNTYLTLILKLSLLLHLKSLLIRRRWTRMISESTQQLSPGIASRIFQRDGHEKKLLELMKQHHLEEFLIPLG